MRALEDGQGVSEDGLATASPAAILRDAVEPIGGRNAPYSAASTAPAPADANRVTPAAARSRIAASA